MNLVAMILAARILGAEGFGGFALIQSTLGLFGLLAGAALGATATRFIAATRRADLRRTGRVIGLVISTALGLALLLGSFVVVSGPWLAREVLGAPNLESAMVLGAFFVGLGLLRGVQDAILAGFEAFKQIAFLRFLEGGAAVILLPSFVTHLGAAGGISALGLGLLMATLPGFVLISQQLRKYQVVIHWRDAIHEWRLLRDFGAPSLIASSVVTPVLWACALLLSRTPNGLVELGIYNGAYQWHGPLVFVPMVIASVSLPILAQAWDHGDQSSFRKLFIKVFVIGMLLSFAPAMVAAFFSEHILAMYGEEYQSGGTVLILLLVAAPLHVASIIATSAIQSMDKTWYLPIFHLIWGAVLLAITDLTISAKGAEGLAFAFLVSYFVLACLKSLFVLWLGSRPINPSSATTLSA